MDDAIKSILNQRDIDMLYKKEYSTFLGKLIKLSTKYPELYDIIEEYCKQNPNKVNKVDKRCQSALIIASLCNSINIVKILCNYKANINHYKRNIWPPLLIAVDHGCIDIVKILCDYGANTNHRSSAGYTPLKLATHRNIIIILLEYDAVQSLNTLTNYSKVINKIALLNVLS